jgi:peroxin-5
MSLWPQAGTSGAERGEYIFAADNPFLGDAAAFEKGKDLFKRGLLSEAALALEAEVGVLLCCYC